MPTMPLNMIANAIRDDPDRPALPCDPTHGICAFTGIEGLCIPRKNLLKKSFTNLDLLLFPDKNMVSVDAWYALKYKWERYSSWICDGEVFTRLDRKCVRNKALFEQMPEKWIAYATTSYKKHGVLNTKINTGKNRVWLFEVRQVDLTDMSRVMDWWGILNKTLRLGFGRTIIESLNCPAFVMNKFGIKAWIEFEKWARPKYLSSLYAFLTYLLPSQDELKELQNESSENN